MCCSIPCVHDHIGMQEPAPPQAAQQGQHHPALSQPVEAPDSAVVTNTSHESALPASAESAATVSAESAATVSAESAATVSAESAAPVSAAATSSMVAGPPSSRAADLAAVTTAESASGVVDGGAEEEVREGTGCMPIVDSLPESTLAEGRLLPSATDLTHVGKDGSVQADTSYLG